MTGLMQKDTSDHRRVAQKRAENSWPVPMSDTRTEALPDAGHCHSLSFSCTKVAYCYIANLVSSLPGIAWTTTLPMSSSPRPTLDPSS